MDPLAEADALVAFEGRAPGSDAERRAALHLARRLRELGRQAEVEPVDAWPGWPGALALLAVAGAAASVLSVSEPVAGAALAAAALLLYLVDAGGGGAGLRRLFGRRATQNVVSLEPGGRAAALVLVAHLDAGRTGFIHRPGVRRPLARLARPRRLVGGLLQPMAWALLAVLACTLARVAGTEGQALAAVQFVPTVLLIVAVALLVDVWLSPTVPGACDNASGVALALRLAERLGGSLEHVRLHVLLSGAQESLADGMRAFLRRHRRDLPRDATLFLNLDEVGAGSVRHTVREGPLLALRSHPLLRELAGEVGGSRPLDDRAPTDAFAARWAGYGAMTVTCRDELGLAPRHHRRTDLLEHLEPGSLASAEDFCAELIERLDARAGAG
jgi:hypothetical protein